MKKLVKILGLLLVAGALFVGCKQDVDPMSAGSPALFKDSAVKKSADKVELSDGDWNFTITYKMGKDYDAVIEEYGWGKVSSNVLAVKAFKFKEKMKLDEDAKELFKSASKDQLKAAAANEVDEEGFTITDVFLDGDYLVIEVKVSEEAIQEGYMGISDGGLISFDDLVAVDNVDGTTITINTDSKKTKYKITAKFEGIYDVEIYLSKR
jgi:hypothetical protein